MWWLIGIAATIFALVLWWLLHRVAQLEREQREADARRARFSHEPREAA